MTTLPELLAGLDPLLRPGRYVFATVPPDAPVPAAAVAAFVEDEGRTLVLPEDEAARLGVAGEYPCAWITSHPRSPVSWSTTVAPSKSKCSEVAGGAQTTTSCPALRNRGTNDPTCSPIPPRASPTTNPTNASGDRLTQNGTTTKRPPYNNAPHISHTEKSNAYE